MEYARVKLSVSLVTFSSKMSIQKRILITGSNGFTGRHLVRMLSPDASLELHLIDRNQPHVLDPRFKVCDLSDTSRTAECVAQIQPHEIYHLVGSYTNDYDTDYASNVITTKNILDAIAKSEMKTRVFLVGSCAEYGFPISKNQAVAEDHQCKPVSVYGLVKLIEIALMQTYVRLYGLDVVAVRPFNLLGSGMSQRLFVGKMEQDIAMYKRGEIKKIITGDLSVERDYIDIEEAIKYYSAVMQKGKTGEVYNVGSGKSISLRALLSRMLEASDLSLDVVQESIHSVPGKIVVPKIFANIGKLKQLT